MTPATLLLLLIVFLAAIALIFVIAKALRSWVFELTPTQWLATVILTFSAGALLVAFLDGNGAIELLASLPILVAIAWWVISAAMSSRSRGAAEED